MGSRKGSTRIRGDDEGRAVAGAPTAAPGRAGNVRDHLLDLQQSYGNTAVAGVVQRRERPASTDAPGARRKKKPPAKTAAPVSYAPTEANPKYSSWATADLTARAAQEAKSDVKNSLVFATELYEEYWFRTKDRGAGVNLYRVYKQLGDGPRSEFWIGVANGSIKPGQVADEDLSDKEF